MARSILEVDGYKELLTESRGFLVDTVEENPDGPIRKKFRSDPGIYGKNFVVMTLQHVADGRSETFRERTLPGNTEWLVRFRDVAMTQKRPAGNAAPAVWESGHEKAERTTEAAYDAFLKGLDRSIHGVGRPPRRAPGGMLIHTVEIVTVEAGDADRLGQPFIDLNNPTQLLWTLTARVRVVYAA